jgi:hypothetical protein
MNWRRRFDDPIPTPDGKTIRTIGDAARYADKLPKKAAASEPWQRARYDLQMSADHAAWVFFARISVYVAIHGDTAPPIGQRRLTKAEQFKARRAEYLRKRKSPPA